MTGREREIKLGLDDSDLVRIHELLGPAAALVIQRNYYLDTPLGDLRRRKHGLRLRLEAPLPPALLDPPADAVRRVLGPLRPWEQAPGESLPLRLFDPRPAPERHILSLKGPSLRVGVWVDRLDEQAEISHSRARDIILEGADALDLPLPHLAVLAREHGLGRVRVLGATDNLRRIYALDLGAARGPDHGLARRPDQEVPSALASLRLEVDSTRYPGGAIEHEAELELPHHVPLSTAARDPGADTRGPASSDAGAARPEKAPLDADAVSAAIRALFDRAGVPWVPSTRGKYARFLERSGLEL